MHPRHRFVRSILALALAAALPFASVHAEPFTFQGHLAQAGMPLTGSPDLAFSLYNTETGGSPLVAPITATNWPVVDGVFTVDLDFSGVAFDGSARWLQVEVDGTPLSGRIEILPAPVSASSNALRGRSVAATAPLDGQVLSWSGGAWIPTTPSAGSSYTAGTGLTLTGSSFSVNFGGSGAENMASRSDHDHYGDAWSGNSAFNALQVFNQNPGAGTGAIAGFNTSNDSESKGLFGQSEAGYGVVGFGRVGTRGSSNDPGGIGVTGISFANTGNGMGVEALGGSPDGFGLWARNAASSGNAIAVYGESTGADGVAMRGNATSTGTGATTGVYGSSLSTNGAGVRGEGSTGVRGKGGTGVSAEGVQFGVSSLATDTTGVALEGLASAATGNTAAVKATVLSPGGVALNGSNLASSGMGLALQVMSLAPDGVAANIEARGIGTSVGLHSVSEGENPDALAVHAQISNSSGAGAALFAEHRSGGVAARLDGVLRMTPRAAAPSSCELGDLYVHDSGALCFCNASGTPGTWEQINATGICL